MTAPATILSGKSGVGIAFLSGPTTVPIYLYPSSNNAAAKVATSITVPATGSYESFSIVAGKVTVDTTVTISVGYFGVAKSRSVIIQAPPLPKYSFVVIKPLVNGTYTQPDAINSKGQVVGTADTTGSNVHGFLYDPSSGVHDMGKYAPSDINDSSLIVGLYPKVSIYQSNIFYYAAGSGFVDPGLPHNTQNSSNPTVFNNGVIFGNAGPVPASYNGSGPYELFQGTFTDPDSGTHQYSSFQCSNHAGFALGTGWANNPPNILAYYWLIKNGAFYELPTNYFTKVSFDVRAIGPDGTYLGRLTTNQHAAIYNGTTVTDLGVVGQALAMNLNGQVVIDDYSSGNGPYAYLWTKTMGAVDIGLLLPKGSGFTIGAVNSINANGQITCSGYSSVYHGALGVALVLTPIP